MLTMQALKETTFHNLNMYPIEDAITEAMLAGKNSVFFKEVSDISEQSSECIHKAGVDRLRQMSYTVEKNSPNQWVVKGWFE